MRVTVSAYNHSEEATLVTNYNRAENPYESRITIYESARNSTITLKYNQAQRLISDLQSIAHAMRDHLTEWKQQENDAQTMSNLPGTHEQRDKMPNLPEGMEPQAYWQNQLN